MSKEPQQVNPYPIRLTKELREKLDTAAKAAGRSLNAEMLLRLEASFLEQSTDAPPLTVDDVRQIAREEIKHVLKHDSEGFLIGDRIDDADLPKEFKSIQKSKDKRRQ
ncbi:MAG: hypothetical protein BWK73_05810 [Thiothrix lacustris]|uniref:Arc-like DNA binding domain-containing protein n=1 Tax=Thiothrix lacustris TaxID=525917 RepID=A0A1Y1QWV4_9GAMM|nr:MAG: hypothetical protein BWK73_05810 [Thiothrix lacustris]